MGIECYLVIDVLLPYFQESYRENRKQLRKSDFSKGEMLYPDEFIFLKVLEEL